MIGNVWCCFCVGQGIKKLASLWLYWFKCCKYENDVGLFGLVEFQFDIFFGLFENGFDNCVGYFGSDLCVVQVWLIGFLKFFIGGFEQLYFVVLMVVLFQVQGLFDFGFIDKVVIVVYFQQVFGFVLAGGCRLKG